MLLGVLLGWFWLVVGWLVGCKAAWLALVGCRLVGCLMVCLCGSACLVGYWLVCWLLAGLNAALASLNIALPN